VFDAAGRRVAVLDQGARGPGRHAVRWDGRDEAGRRAPAGVYFCLLAAGSALETQRFVLLH
jgi:flagellar hook assembly protein FlgD